MDVLEQVGSDWDREHLKPGSHSSRKSQRAENHLISRAYVHKIANKLTQEAIDKLHGRVIIIAEMAALDALEFYDVDHSQNLSKTHWSVL